MAVNCDDTNVPSVDETQLECCEIISTKCVSLEESVPSLAVPIGSTLTKFIQRIVSYFNTLNSSVTTIQNYINTSGEILVADITVTPAQLATIEQGSNTLSLLTAPAGKLIYPVDIVIEKTGDAGESVTAFTEDVRVYSSTLNKTFLDPASPNRVYALNRLVEGGVTTKTILPFVSDLSLEFFNITNPGLFVSGTLNLKIKIYYKLFDSI